MLLQVTNSSGNSLYCKGGLLDPIPAQEFIGKYPVPSSGGLC